MYRRSKFLEILDEVRQQMSREADYDIDLFAEIVRQGKKERGHAKKKEPESQNFTPLEGLATEIRR